MALVRTASAAEFAAGAAGKRVSGRWEPGRSLAAGAERTAPACGCCIVGIALAAVD